MQRSDVPPSGEDDRMWPSLLLTALLLLVLALGLGLSLYT